MICGTAAMPRIVFGTGYGGGSTFCRTAGDCEMSLGGPYHGCYRVAPGDETLNEYRCSDPKPLSHCECNYGQCSTISQEY